MLRRLLPLVLLSGCTPEASLPDQAVVVRLADESGPLTGRTITNVRAYFFQPYPGAAEDFVDTPVADGTFDLVIPIETYAETMQFRLEFTDAGGIALVGGTPAYYPAESTSIDVRVGPEGSCARLRVLGRDARLYAARESAGVTLLGTYTLHIGGVGSAGASNAIDAIDHLGYTVYGLDPQTTPAGATRMVPVSRSRALVAVAGAAPYVHRLYVVNSTEIRSTPSLHTGADTADALVAFPGGGALILGGGLDGATSASASLVRASTTSSAAEDVTPFTLRAPADERAAASHDEGVFVVSYEASAVVLEELREGSSASRVLIASLADSLRKAPRLLVSDDGKQALLFGGTDTGGTIRTDTVWIHDCDTTCVAEAGPTWNTARGGVFLEPSGFLVGGDGSTAVERVTFGTGLPVITKVADLGVVRRNPSVVRYPTGTLVVSGGHDGVGPRDDIELCFLRP